MKFTPSNVERLSCGNGSVQSQLVVASVTDHASHEDGLGVAEDRRAEETGVDVSDMLEVPRQGGWLGGEDERERWH